MAMPPPEKRDPAEIERSTHPGGPAAPVRRRASFLSRLSTGTGAFNLLGRRRYYYIFSSVLILASIVFILVRGFHFGIDFAGGTRLTFQPAGTPATSDISSVFDTATGTEATVQTIGARTVQVTSVSLDPTQLDAARQALTTTFRPTGAISDAAVSGTWGSQISQRALIAVIIFLVLVGVFIWVRYEKRVAVGAVVSVLHDLLITAGVYAAVGFEVAPATVIGLLTILGFSLYDTVVVYDKVQENSRGLLSLTRRTYPEAANLAVNQTLMRSINTSLIALLPVAGLLVAGVAILGSGTLKDLALVLLIGMLIGAYSSVFVAVPLAVELKVREPAIKAHMAKVAAKRRADGLVVDADGDPVGRKGLTAGPIVGEADAPRPATSTPRPGVKPGKPVRRPIQPAGDRPGRNPIMAAGSTPMAAAPTGPAAATAPAGSIPAAAGPGSTPAPPVRPAPAKKVRARAVGPAEDIDASVESPAGNGAGDRRARATDTRTAARPTGKAKRPSGKRGR